ncbi:MAG: hypothetical protein WCH82_12330 [Mycobacteriaceae bacterium]
MPRWRTPICSPADRSGRATPPSPGRRRWWSAAAIWSTWAPATTYGSDIPGVDIPEIPPLIQIEALLTRRRPGHPEDLPQVARQRIGLYDALRGYTINGAYQPCRWCSP